MVAAQDGAETERLAEAMGASYLRAAGADLWRRGAGQARGDWLVLLDAGDAPEPHWTQSVDRHLLLMPGRAALLPLRGAVAAFRERVSVALGPHRLRAGLVLPKAAALAGRLTAAPRRLSTRRERADA